MADKHMEKSEIYQREYSYIFSKKAFCVRGATVSAGFIEGQIFSLAKMFIEGRNIKYLPRPGHEYSQSLNVLETNGILTKQEVKEIGKFREERNKSIHGMFKGMTIRGWEEQNNKVVSLGRPIIEKLDKILYRETA